MQEQLPRAPAKPIADETDGVSDLIKFEEQTVEALACNRTLVRWVSLALYPSYTDYTRIVRRCVDTWVCPEGEGTYSEFP
jgi:hypothetical protein